MGSVGAPSTPAATRPSRRIHEPEEGGEEAREAGFEVEEEGGAFDDEPEPSQRVTDGDSYYDAEDGFTGRNPICDELTRKHIIPLLLKSNRLFLYE